MANPFYTIGHSIRALEEFVPLLVSAGIRLVVDVRTVPRSRTNPQYNSDRLGDALASHQIGYEHIGELGGLRPRQPDVPPDVNGLWRNQSFHNYADYALSDEFRYGLQHLRQSGHGRVCAIMCAEAVWWRCHRRIIADHLIALGETVLHIMGPEKIEPARLTAGAHIDGPAVMYPAAS